MDKVYPQLTLDNSSHLHLIVYFSKKMIPAETRYENYNNKILTIVKVFKIWRHYLEDSKYKVLVLIDYNNLHYFMDTKTLSSKQVH